LFSRHEKLGQPFFDRLGLAAIVAFLGAAFLGADFCGATFLAFEALALGLARE
jgi:hypothetical protein